MSDSTAPGVLVASVTDAAGDLTLDTILQNWVVSLSGLPGYAVRQRYQPAPPAQPTQSTDWCVVGFTSFEPYYSPYIACDGTDPGNVIMQRHETMRALVSFAGPNAVLNCERLISAAYLGQNRVALDAADIVLVDTGQPRLAPDLVNEVWVRRIDLEMVFRRQIDSTFPVRSLVSSAPTVVNDSTS